MHRHSTLNVITAMQCMHVEKWGTIRLSLATGPKCPDVPSSEGRQHYAT